MKKYIIFTIILSVILLGYVFLFKNEKKIYTPNKIYKVSIAQTKEELELGLSNTKNLKKDTVKLFIFNKPDYYGFWMKDMLYPIDIVFLDEQMNVISYYDNVTPKTYPNTFYPDRPALYVMEMNTNERSISGLDKNIKVYYK